MQGCVIMKICSWLVPHAVWAAILSLQRFAQAQSALILPMSINQLVFHFLKQSEPSSEFIFCQLSLQFVCDAGGAVMFTSSLLGLKKMGIRTNVLCPEVLTMYHVLAMSLSNISILPSESFKYTIFLGALFGNSPVCIWVSSLQRRRFWRISHHMRGLFVNPVGYVPIERLIEGKKHIVSI